MNMASFKSNGRWKVSIALGCVLVALLTLGMLFTRYLSRDIDRAQDSLTAADRYESGQFDVSGEITALDSYRVTGDPGLHANYVNSAGDLNALLTQAKHDQPDDADAVTALIATQARLQAQARTYTAYVVAGDTAKAEALAEAELDPLADQLQGQFTELQDKHHALAVTRLGHAAKTANQLRIEAPLLILISLTVLMLLSVISRKRRRDAVQQALHDALTGLPNRTLFADRAELALLTAQRTNAEPAVMILDLDQFKEVNDTLGHFFGDQLLIEVADRLVAALRPGDTIARFGGDEFALLLTDGGTDAATQVARRVGVSLDQPFDLKGVTIGIEASIGIATEDPADQDAAPLEVGLRVEELLRRADNAMYTAKAERTGFAFYVEREDQMPNRLALLGELRQALDRGELVVHYQPKVSAETGALVGLEALVRWQHPVRGLLPPAEFIALAESTTLIQRLTYIVLADALELSRSWAERGHRIPVSVNVSARSFLDPLFPAAVADRLAAAGLDASLLCLELTESTIMVDPPRALAVLGQLHDMGVRLSVDDFGTGYSSMAYLKILPVDELKVDRMFVGDMATNEANTMLVRSAVDLGHNLGLAVVAEGVEDSATLQALRETGADVIQGYFTGRPMGAEALTEWMATHGMTPTAVQP
jgi:diguanylate cyclase